MWVSNFEHLFQVKSIFSYELIYSYFLQISLPRKKIMGHNQIVLTCDKLGHFFIVYKCVNQVTSQNTYFLEPSSEDANVNSIHLRSNSSSFIEVMSRRIQPLLDTSSHLSFPTTSSNNITSMGRASDLSYFTSGQSVFSGIALNRYDHVSSHFLVNNRNYTGLIHGIENRKQCLDSLENMDSINFSRNSSFPPLKSASTFEKKVCQNQIYGNSFALNTQRQTDESLVETAKELLSQILLYAKTDVSLNNMCVEWEIKLRHNLSFPEKCHILIHHEVCRAKYRGKPGEFQKSCASIKLLEYDDMFKKNFFGIGRQKRNNPEMIDLFPFLPLCMKQMIMSRWVEEQKFYCVEQVLKQTPGWAECDIDIGIPPKIKHWTDNDIINVVRFVIQKLK